MMFNPLLIKCANTLRLIGSLQKHNQRLIHRLYSKQHEWIAIERDIGTIGITDYGQQYLGDIVYAELPEVGLQLNEDDCFGLLESVKAVHECYSPLAGTVLETNGEVKSNPGIINQHPLTEGWLIKLKLSDPEIAKKLLMTKDEYDNFLRRE